MNGHLQANENALVAAKTKSVHCSEHSCGDVALIPQPAGSAFYRYLLAETFGSSLVGAGAKRTRSEAIINFRMYVATTQSDIMMAVDDGLCLMLPGCTINDPRILLEGRKRHLAGVTFMQKFLKTGTQDVDSVIASAIEFMFVDIFKPTSLGAKNLYAGVVYLVQKFSQHLKTSQTPVTTFLLIQLRQLMLLESLASRTSLPVDTDLWDNLASTSTLPATTETLMRLAIQVPGLLSHAREAMELNIETGSPSACEQAVLPLHKLECHLIQWDLYRPPSRVKSRGIDDKTIAKQDHGCEETSFLIAQCQAMCNICLLLIRESLADLFAAQGEEKSNQYYIKQAAATADELCELAERFMEEEEHASLSKALSVRAPLHFARRWYETSDDSKMAANVRTLEAQVQKEVPFLSWQSLLPMSLVSMYMLG